MAKDITSEEFKEIVREYDIIHFNECVKTGEYPPGIGHYFKDGERVNLFDCVNGSQKVFRHSNGTYYRNNYPELNVIMHKHNIFHTVSTPDLCHLGGGWWLPQPIPITGTPKYDFNPPDDNHTIRISHCPTNIKIKGTDQFLKVMKHEYPEIEVSLIKDVDHEECMQRRRNCHIHYDQFSLGAYGVASLEGLAMGQLVCVGLRKVRRFIPDNYFFDMEASYDSMRNSIGAAIEIVKNPERYVTHLKRGRNWLKKWHEDKTVARWLCSLYQHAGYWRD
jgi:hypothetical protein